MYKKYLCVLQKIEHQQNSAASAVQLSESHIHDKSNRVSFRPPSTTNFEPVLKPDEELRKTCFGRQRWLPGRPEERPDICG